MKFSCSKFSLANMETIVAVIFFGYLGYTFAVYNYVLPTQCKNLDNKAKVAFDKEKFFEHKDWYVTHLKIEGNNPECTKFVARIIKEENQKLSLEYRKGGKDFKCEGFKNPTEKHFCFVCHVAGKPDDIKKFFTVIDVDAGYVSYALVYICNDAGSVISGKRT
ncbi:triafestin-1-like isoform X2 [Rhodnius prolixus]|uniref:triafestin-1-like isoform X2 n=1 Tax=Rhodnius prolixus TaxID=13249 RepID=UPI003D18868D